MVVLLLSRDSGRMWLELQNQRSIYEDTEDESVIKVYIGAEYDGRQWAAVQPEANEGAERFFILGPPETEDGWLDKSKVSLFQKAIIEKWKNFSGSRASSFAMGTSLGKSMTPASFVAKALAIGFEAVGLPTVAYSGVKLSSWGFHDVVKYAGQHGKLLRFTDRELMTVSDFEDFIELAPHPKFAGKEAPGDNPRDLRRDKDVELILSGQKSGHSGNFAYADELKDFAKLRKVCYGFRGDSRGPVLLKKEFSGAFTPNYTRADHAKKLDRYGELEKVPTQSYESDEDRQKAVAEAEREIAPLKPNFVNAKGRTKSASEAETGALNLEDYIANEFAGGFISLTRYARVARVFASGGGGNAGGRRTGWCYVCFAEGAINVPLKGQAAWATKDEFELAMPGLLEWQDIVGWRKIALSGMFEGPIFLRKSFSVADPKAFKAVYHVLSGKNQ